MPLLGGEEADRRGYRGGGSSDSHNPQLLYDAQCSHEGIFGFVFYELAISQAPGKHVPKEGRCDFHCGRSGCRQSDETGGQQSDQLGNPESDEIWNQCQCHELGDGSGQEEGENPKRYEASGIKAVQEYSGACRAENADFVLVLRRYAKCKLGSIALREGILGMPRMAEWRKTMEIIKGTKKDVDEVSALYDAICDYLDEHTNYPGWRKGIYPAREDALQGVEEDNLFVATIDGKIAGTFILRHQPEEGYETAKWKKDLDYSDIFVIHTLAVHPQFLQMGIGKEMLGYILELASREEMKSIRLDVYEKNIPAMHLYEKCGFEYVDTVDMGFGAYGLDWFKLYERLVEPV